MRAPVLLISLLALALAAPSAAVAKSPTTTGAAAATGGAEYAEYAASAAAAVAPTRVVVPGRKAVRLPNGYAAAPAEAPAAVQAAIFAANEIVGKPYRYGGGHVRLKDSGYDCSGTVSYALHGASLLKAPLPSGWLMRWGRRGKGRWITVYAHSSHAYAVIAGLRLDTSSAGERVSSGNGPRWRTNARRQAGFVRRHPKGL